MPSLLQSLFGDRRPIKVIRRCKQEPQPKLIGIRIVFGIPKELKPIIDAPPGRQRLRLRADKPAVLFVRSEKQFRAFKLQDLKSAWAATLEIGRNTPVKMPFSKPTLRVETGDGRYFTLLEPLVYTANSGEVITAPAGTTTDGASTPRAIWNLIPPFGPYWLAAVLHDYLYRVTQRPKAECDSLLFEAMTSLGVDHAMRDTIYEGVRIGGKSSFENDRAVD